MTCRSLMGQLGNAWNGCTWSRPPGTDARPGARPVRMSRAPWKSVGWHRRAARKDLAFPLRGGVPGRSDPLCAANTTLPGERRSVTAIPGQRFAPLQPLQTPQNAEQAGSFHLPRALQRWAINPARGEHEAQGAALSRVSLALNTSPSQACWQRTREDASVGGRRLKGK